MNALSPNTFAIANKQV